MQRTPRIAVIGAGIAGLSCATALREAGLEPAVFDKGRGPSGRMSTHRGEDWQCDHGAQYFTARSPQFRAEVARWQEAGAAARWSPRLRVLDGASTSEPGSDLARFVGVPRMSAPARLLAGALDLRTGVSVDAARRAADRWQLRSVEHGWLAGRFEALVLAVPAPQAVPLLEPLAPSLAALAARVRMRGSRALMLRFAAPLALPFDAAFVNYGPLRWIARDSSKPGRGGTETWLLHANAAWSEVHIDEDAQTVAELLLAAFVELGGARPAAWSAHRWRYADTEAALDQGCAWQPELRIGLCGDWLNGGKVEGAWLSGRALAGQLRRAFEEAC